jgi:hypothetical protein
MRGLVEVVEEKKKTRGQGPLIHSDKTKTKLLRYRYAERYRISYKAITCVL